jgi:DNA (cytosine-5)-methyltransferase 1
VQAERLAGLRAAAEPRWATAYRRTRAGRAVWEIRGDEISGCLRTARGGSSKQALVEAGGGEVRVRWMTAREYARLQGVPDDFTLDAVTPNQALFGLGDAVCVPVVSWVVSHYLLPMVETELPLAA